MSALSDCPTVIVGQDETTLQSRTFKPNEFTCNRCGVVQVAIVREFEETSNRVTEKKLELDTRCPKCGKVIWETLAVPCEGTPIRSEFWTALKAANKFNGIKTEKIVTCLPLPRSPWKDRKPCNPIKTGRPVCPYKDVAHLIKFTRIKWPDDVVHLTEDIETTPLAFEAIEEKGVEVTDVVAELRAEIQELKETVMSLSVLKDIQKIAVPSSPPAPGSASTSGGRDWSKIPTDRLQAMHSKFLVGSPKHCASLAELKARASGARLEPMSLTTKSKCTKPLKC